MSFFEVRTIEWRKPYIITEDTRETKVKQQIEIDTYFFKTEDEALELYKGIKESFDLFIKDNNLELLVPGGIEGGEGIDANLSSGLSFDTGSLNYWLDTGDIHLGVILFECEFEGEQDDMESDEV